MKNTLLIASLSILFFISCKKDRIEEDTFSSMDEFYEENRQEVQEFVITNEDSGRVIGKYGTELFFNSSIFEDSADRNIEVPYTIKLVEVYTYKDMIMYGLFSGFSGGYYDVFSDLWIMAEKENRDLRIKSGFQMSALLTPIADSDDKEVYFGGRDLSPFSSWVEVQFGMYALRDGDEYKTYISELGWSCTSNKVTAPSTTDVTCKINANGTENIDIWIVLHDKKVLLNGDNLIFNNVPIDEPATLLAMAIDQNGKIRFHKEGIIVKPILTVDLEMEEISKDKFIFQLESLD